MKALDYLVDKKFVKNIGVCNFTISNFQKAQALSKYKLVANQLHYNLVHRQVEKYKKTPVQIAINWLISQKNVVTLVKSTNLDHLSENLGAVGWFMNAEDIEYLRANFPIQLNNSSSYLEDQSKIYN